VQEILVDGRQLFTERFIQFSNDFRITFHGEQSMPESGVLGK
jgi:hypothetical protein